MNALHTIEEREFTRTPGVSHPWADPEAGELRPRSRACGVAPRQDAGRQQDHFKLGPFGAEAGKCMGRSLSPAVPPQVAAQGAGCRPEKRDRA